MGPCCGIRWPGARTEVGEEMSDIVVCHACIGDSPARPCQLDPPASDFPLMSSAQMLGWKSFMEQREAQLGELVWRDLNDEVHTSSGQRVDAPGETAGAGGRCVQCQKDYVPAIADGGYCSACWTSCCWICGCWAHGLRRASVPERWECSSCSRLQPRHQDFFRAMAAALGASFIPCLSSCCHHTLEEARTAKAGLPVPQPARVADWLYLGDIHDVERLVAERPHGVRFAGILSLCPESMGRVDGVNRFGQLQGFGCAHQVVAASDSMGFDMISQALPAAMNFARPFFERRATLLVHGRDGINRSAFIVAALLVLLEDMPLTDALRAIAASRGRVLTNRSLRAQLLEIAARTGRWV